jgi:hypothetical protein
VSGDITGRDKTLIGLDEKEIGRRIDDAQRSVTEQPVALTTQIARQAARKFPNASLLHHFRYDASSARPVSCRKFR